MKTVPFMGVILLGIVLLAATVAVSWWLAGAWSAWSHLYAVGLFAGGALLLLPVRNVPNRRRPDIRSEQGRVYPTKDVRPGP